MTPSTHESLTPRRRSLSGCALAIAAAALLMLSAPGAVAQSQVEEITDFYAYRAPRTPSAKDKLLAKMRRDKDALVNVTSGQMPNADDILRVGEETLPALEGCVANNLDPSVRRDCLRLITKMRPAHLDTILVASMQDPSAAVWGDAMLFLKDVETTEGEDLLLRMATTYPSALANYSDAEAINERRIRAQQVLARRGASSFVEPLLRLYERTGDVQIQNTLWSMRRLLSDQDIQRMVLAPFIDAYRARNDVLAFSIQRAGELRLRSAVSVLLAVLANEDHYEHHDSVVEALGEIGDDSVIVDLTPLVDPLGDPYFQKSLMIALYKLNYDVKPTLRAWAVDSRGYIRSLALSAMEQIDDPALVPDIEAMIWDVNQSISSRALALLEDRSLDDAKRLLEAQMRSTRGREAAAIFAELLRLDYPAYREQALEKLSDPDYSSEVLQAILSMAEPELLPVLVEHIDPTSKWQFDQVVRMLRSFQTMENEQVLALLVRWANTGDSRALMELIRFDAHQTQTVLASLLRETSKFSTNSAYEAHGARKSDLMLPTAREAILVQGRSSQLTAARYMAQLEEPGAIELIVDTLMLSSDNALRNQALGILLALDETIVAPHLDRIRTLATSDFVYERMLAAQFFAIRGEPQAMEQFATELAKKSPLVTEHVLQRLRELPAELRKEVVTDLLKVADPFLAEQLKSL